MTEGDSPQIAQAKVGTRLSKLYTAIWKWLGKHADYVMPLEGDYPAMHLRHGTYDKGKPFYDPALSETFLRYLDTPESLFHVRAAMDAIRKADKSAYAFAALKIRGWTNERIAEVLGQKAWRRGSSLRLIKARLRIMSAVIGLVPESKIRGWGLLAARDDLAATTLKYGSRFRGQVEDDGRECLLLRDGWQRAIGGQPCDVIFPHPTISKSTVGDMVWIKKSKTSIAGEARIAGIEPATFNGQGFPVIGRGKQLMLSPGDIVWIFSLVEGRPLEEVPS
ncbi:MAG: hypothetical protein WC565_08750 [Parcubacteria group bacterium]|jgi:hypothetical protein